MYIQVQFSLPFWDHCSRCCGVFKQSGIDAQRSLMTKGVLKHSFLPARAGFKTSFHCWKSIDPVSSAHFQQINCNKTVVFSKLFSLPTSKY